MTRKIFGGILGAFLGFIIGILVLLVIIMKSGSIFFASLILGFGWTPIVVGIFTLIGFIYGFVRSNRKG